MVLYVQLEMIFFILHITIFSKAVLKVTHISLIDLWDVSSSFGDPRRPFCSPSLMDWLLWIDEQSLFYLVEHSVIIFQHFFFLFHSINVPSGCMTREHECYILWEAFKESAVHLIITTCYHCKFKGSPVSNLVR